MPPSSSDAPAACRLPACAVDRPLPTIAGYRIIEAAGRGSHGGVYRALRGASLIPVAIKLLEWVPDREGRDRWWREVGLLESYRLSCLPRLLDHGEVEGRPYLVTEFIDGLPIDEHCRISGLSRPERIELLASMADAVEELHGAGLIHRDLKPANVLIAKGGRPMLVDLGTALPVEGSAFRLTLTGVPIGTPACMAPEQARGERGLAGRPADIWSVGAMAWMILVGRAPHDMEGSLAAVIRRIAFEPPPPVRSIDPTLPAPLASVLDRAVAFEASARYPSAALFAADLRRAGRGERVSGEGAALPRWSRQLLARSSLGGVLLLLPLVAVIGVLAPTPLIRRSEIHPPSAWVDPTRRFAGLRLAEGSVQIGVDVGEEATIAAAIDIDAEDDPEGRGLLLIGIETPSGSSVSGLLEAREATDMSVVRWSAGCPGRDLIPPDWISEVKGERFVTSILREADIFDSAGAQILAVHEHRPSSPACIRVYSARGEVLFECWHDGDIEDLRWLPGARLLVAFGSNGEAFWAERGVPDAGHNLYPKVLFAVRPVLGERLGFLRTPGGRGTASPAWYRALLPPELAQSPRGLGEPKVSLEAPGHGLSGADHVRLCFTPLGAPPRSLVFVLDAEGREREDLREAKSAYRAAPGLPAPKRFFFGDLPPITSRRRDQAR